MKAFAVALSLLATVLLCAPAGAVNDKVQKYIAPPESSGESSVSGVVKDDPATSAAAAKAGAVLR